MKTVRQGDIVFVQGKGIISKLVRFVDRGIFSHVAIAVSETHIIEATAGSKVAVIPFDKSEYNIIEVVDLGLTAHQRRMVYNCAMRYVGRRYDYLQLIWYVLRKMFHLTGENKLNNPHNMICSELVYVALDESRVLEDLGIKDSFRNGNNLTPNELFDLVKYVSVTK
ncbi:YiiX/YebB-like N1pC/P60 family cysteine hydrolase [Bacillus cereus]|uniref:YiiX/YebB-like N1pC/P60 family cysteine hydrolase n=1 Tax=Bacillus cereus TaxID=1396 RepID=UPI001D138B87|nr:YiiX/YebB-like N1pC/P60 family cysteine hydrolase [Bacillus cereus]MCC3687529.1 hypothetical protein [Bacillus cereus]